MKRVFALALILLMICMAMPAFAAGTIAGSTPTDMIYISNDTRIKVRERPDGKAEQLGWAESGSKYPYLGMVSTWYCIDYNGRVGYISNTLGGVISGDSNAKYVTVTSANGINVRSAPDSKSKQVGKGDMKDIFLYAGEENGWYKVICQGKTGYVSKKLAKLFSNDAGSANTGSSTNSVMSILSAISKGSSAGNTSSEVNDSTPTDSVRITNKTRIAVRSQATADSNRIGYAEANQSYPYLGTIGAWYCIRFNGGIGYVSDNLAVIDQKEGSKAQYVAISHTSGVNVRATPFEDGKKIGATDPGNKYLYKGTENGWYKILYGESIGYVSSKLTTLTDGKTAFSRVYISRNDKEEDDDDWDDGDWDDDNDGGGKGKFKNCKKCYGTGMCHSCFGNGYAYNNGRRHQCYSCGGSRRCVYCAGLGRVYSP